MLEVINVNLFHLSTLLICPSAPHNVYAKQKNKNMLKNK